MSDGKGHDESLDVSIRGVDSDGGSLKESTWGILAHKVTFGAES